MSDLSHDRSTVRGREMTSQLHWDLVGGERPLPPAAYRQCITRDCPDCHAAPAELCRDTNGRPRRNMPCIARLRRDNS